MSKLIFCTCKTITTKYRKLCIPVFLLPLASSALKQLMVGFYSKKCIFRWGLKRATRYRSVKKYDGTNRVKALKFN